MATVVDSKLAGWLGLTRRWREAFAALAIDVSANLMPYLVVLIVLCIDSGLIGLDLAFRYAILDGSEITPWFNTSEETGLGELFEYVMTGLGAVMLAYAARRNGSRILAALALLMLYLTLDNSLQLHEGAGVVLEPFMPSDLPIGAPQLGELLFMAAFGTVILGLILGLVRAEPSPLMAGAGLVMAMILGAAFFGVIVDAAHSFINETNLVAGMMLGGVEDVGELICFTLAGAFSLILAVCVQAGASGTVPD